MFICHGIEAEARAQTKSAVTKFTGRRVNEKKDTLRDNSEVFHALSKVFTSSCEILG